MKEKMSKKTFIVLIILFCLAFVSFFLSSVERTSYLKNQFSIGKHGGIDVFQAVKKEFIQSGQLIADKIFPESFLTKEGIVLATNYQRVENGILRFSTNGKLDAIARLRLDDMFDKNYFAHESPTGRSASDDAELVGYEYVVIGENIALGDFENDEVLVEAWMNSPGHRANILNSRFTEIGIAVFKGDYQDKQTWIAVQIFAKPISDCPSVSSQMKNEIEKEIEAINLIKAELEVLLIEIKKLEENPRRNNEDYIKKIEEYNSMVQEINSKNYFVQELIGQYNEQIRAFNICIEK